MTYNKRVYIFLIPLIFLMGCKRVLFNISLEKVGVYEDKIKLQQVQRSGQKIVFFPMIHIGTELKYKDIALKIDSLEKIGFTFYLESIEADIKNDSILRKYKKITGLALNKGGYTDNIDSLFKGKFKPKKEIISQPSYPELGVDSLKGRVVDRTLSDLISYYENNYGKIILEECDFKTSLFEKTICNDKKIVDSVKYDYKTHYRNVRVIQEILQDTASNIAIIYGKNHIKGIKEELLENGFLEN